MSLLSAENKIRLAETAPPACSSCYSQHTDQLHVDFGAAFDGPVLNREDVITSGVANVQIDDLVICETCLRAAAALLPENDTTDKDAEAEHLLERLRGLEDYTKKLEAALASKPQRRAQTR